MWGLIRNLPQDWVSLFIDFSWKCLTIYYVITSFSEINLAKNNQKGLLNDPLCYGIHVRISKISKELSTVAIAGTSAIIVPMTQVASTLTRPSQPRVRALKVRAGQRLETKKGAVASLILATEGLATAFEGRVTPTTHEATPRRPSLRVTFPMGVVPTSSPSSLARMGRVPLGAKGAILH